MNYLKLKKLFQKRSSPRTRISHYFLWPWKKLSETPEVNDVYIRITKKKRKDFKEFTFEKTSSKNIPFTPPENDEAEQEVTDTDSSSIENNP